ncbi:MAG: hypothetical protein HFJ80_05810 [Clostridiales bacterium]|nr:hypothetical protein [Clostridiales bacterium]
MFENLEETERLAALCYSPFMLSLMDKKDKKQDNWELHSMGKLWYTIYLGKVGAQGTGSWIDKEGKGWTSWSFGEL